MRSALGLGKFLGLFLGLLMILSASAEAATLHRTTASGIGFRTHQRLTVRPGQGVAPPTGVVVPGWTDEETRRWLYNATSGSRSG
jgi:hypothetical protein